jgi:putative Holliday junction resolvase
MSYPLNDGSDFPTVTQKMLYFKPNIFSLAFYNKIGILRYMAHLAIDYGKKYIGLAVSDPDGVLAFPSGVVANNDKTIDVIMDLIKEKSIDVIVIGDSIDEHGEKNHIAKYATEFGNEIKEKSGLPVHYINESFTSSHARFAFDDTKIKGRIDASAAALILQRFLDKQKQKHY